MKVPKEYKDLALVPESVLRKRHDLDDLRRKKAALDEQNNKGQPKKKGTYVVKPETFLAKAKNRQNERARYLRVKKKGMMKRASNKPIQKSREIRVGDEEDEVETIPYQSNSVGASMVFAIRIREDAGKVPKEVYNVLARLRLKSASTGVFLKYDPVTRKYLHLVEPWVVYGKPSEGIVKDLLERKSFGNVRGEKTPLSDNTILERELGNEHGILCMEDMVHELNTAGDSFNAVSKFLWPFPLSSIHSKFEKEKLALKQGKDYGDKGEAIDDYIKMML
jgi:large subunit ribosomal protein L7e